MDQPENIICGIKNIGSSCYMNSMIQLIIKCNVLTKYLKNNEIYTPILNSYKYFINDYEDNTKVVNPYIIKNTLCITNNNLNNNEAQDSHEALITFLDIIKQNIKSEADYRVKKDKSVVIKEGITLYELFDALFGIDIVNIIVCCECKNYTKSEVTESILSLEIKNDQENIKDMLLEFNKEEELFGDNRWKCDKCEKQVKSTTRNFIVSNPKYFFIHLKRFNNDGTKKENAVVIDSYISINKSVYELRGFLVHTGGHYISYIRTKRGWNLIDDEIIQTKTDEEIEVLKKNAYIILYIKVK